MQKQITHKTNAKFAKQKEYKIIRNIILSAMTEKNNTAKPHKNIHKLYSTENKKMQYNKITNNN